MAEEIKGMSGKGRECVSVRAHARVSVRAHARVSVREGVLICVLTWLNLKVSYTHARTHTKKLQILCFVPSKAWRRQWVLKEWSLDFFSSL